jgi:arylsulfatase A
MNLAKKMGVGLACLHGLTEVTSLSAASPPVRPNVLLIYADDMGYGDLGVQNPESRIPTPHLDRLAREGMRFTDAHSASGVCTPSRYSLLTGRYAWRHQEDIVRSWEPPLIESDRLTLPQVLRERGYRTACIGKWHLGWDWDAIRNADVADRNSPAAHDWTRPVPGGPVDHGFDYYFGDDVPNFPPYTWIENDRILSPPTLPFQAVPRKPDGRPGPMVEGWRLDAVMPRLTEKVVEWLGEQKRDEPFFLYWSWTSPHTPIVPLDEFRGTSKAGAYGDFMVQSDAHLGQVLEALDDLGLADNTLVIFSSDNGPENIAYPRIRGTGHDSRGGLRGVKRDIWEGGHRVPFLVRWPGVIEPGLVNDALISQIDLMATLASIIGIELPEDAAEDSYDLSPLLRGEQPTVPRTTLVHRTFGQPWGLRHGPWLYIDRPSGDLNREPGWLGYPEHTEPDVLNKLTDDFGQRDNRVAAHPDIAAEMRALLRAIRQSSHTAPRFRNHSPSKPESDTEEK